MHFKCRSRTTLFSAGLAVVATLFSTGAGAAETIRLDSGLIADVAADASGVRLFKGIPFAAPPTGELRWQKPHPVKPWDGIRQAQDWGPRCMQSNRLGDIDSANKRMEEDCLYLNVWTPAKPAADKLPVMVWIHGGSNNVGAGSQPDYHGNTLATKGVIVVTINYRLDVFGFLAHPELTRESGSNASGNYGLLGQIAALEWVSKNIAAFGGDPARVTIFGESAGAFDVSLLMVSPLAKGLFARAIGESGDAVLGLYPPGATQDEDKATYAALFGDEIISYGAWAWAERASASTPTYRYLFSRRPPGAPELSVYPLTGPGVYHSAELYYVFGNLAIRDWPWEADDRRLADAMTSYWVNFAKTGNPNGDGLPQWPAYRPGGDGQVMQLGTAIVAGSELHRDRYEFFDAYYRGLAPQ